MKSTPIKNRFLIYFRVESGTGGTVVDASILRYGADHATGTSIHIPYIMYVFHVLSLLSKSVEKFNSIQYVCKLEPQENAFKL